MRYGRGGHWLVLICEVTRAAYITVLASQSTDGTRIRPAVSLAIYCIYIVSYRTVRTVPYRIVSYIRPHRVAHPDTYMLLLHPRAPFIHTHTHAYTHARAYTRAQAGPSK